MDFFRDSFGGTEVAQCGEIESVEHGGRGEPHHSRWLP